MSSRMLATFDFCNDISARDILSGTDIVVLIAPSRAVILSTNTGHVRSSYLLFHSV